MASLATICIWSPRYILVMTWAVAELAFPLAAPAAATMRSGRMPTRARVPRTARPWPRTTIPAPEGCNVLRGRVEVASFLGVTLQYLVRTPGGEELTVIEQNRAGMAGGSVGPGQEVLLAWRPEHTFVVTKEHQHGP